MGIFRLYSGDDGESHIEELDLASQPDLTALHGAKGVVFRSTAPGSFSDWHNAPRRQYIITLSGEAEIGLGDGTSHRLGPALAFVLRHRQTRAARLSVLGEGGGTEGRLDLSWVPQGWWKAVTGRHRRGVPVLTVDRRYLELCVLSCAMIELKSGDLCIAGSERFSGYRDHLVTWEEYGRQIATYCQQVGLAADPAQFVDDLQRRLTEAIHTTDAAFPTNTALTIHDGEPVLRRLKKQPEPEGLGLIDRLRRASARRPLATASPLRRVPCLRRG